MLIDLDLPPRVFGIQERKACKADEVLLRLDDYHLCSIHRHEDGGRISRPVAISISGYQRPSRTP